MKESDIDAPKIRPYSVQLAVPLTIPLVAPTSSFY